jgi:hypothetical protein
VPYMLRCARMYCVCCIFVLVVFSPLSIAELLAFCTVTWLGALAMFLILIVSVP